MAKKKLSEFTPEEWIATAANIQSQQEEKQLEKMQLAHDWKMDWMDRITAALAVADAEMDEQFRKDLCSAGSLLLRLQFSTNP